MHCGVSVSELYGIIVLHRQLNILFKALPPIVLTIVNVYMGNKNDYLEAEQCTQDTKYVKMDILVTHPSFDCIIQSPRVTLSGCAKNDAAPFILYSKKKQFSDTIVCAFLESALVRFF